MRTIRHIVEQNVQELPLRIDKYLLTLNDEDLYSRTFIDRLIEKEKVKLNHKTVTKKSLMVNANDVIELLLEDTLDEDSMNQPKGEDIPLKIVFEDDYLIVVDKPAGMTVHPAPGNYQGTLVNALIHHAEGALSNCSESFRPGIVHRLDKDTSGLLIIAKTDKIHAQLSDLIQKREVKKKYKAILVGNLHKENGIIDMPIARSTRNRQKMTVSENGKNAITKYTLLKDYEYFSFVDIELVTGRTHQIRVHFSALNCPILGDTTYNTRTLTLSRVPVIYQKRVSALLTNHLNRQALHAYEISFIHPVTQCLVVFNSPLPDDISYTINWLDKNFT